MTFNERMTLKSTISGRWGFKSSYPLERCATRLAEYENTGLSPAEVERFKYSDHRTHANWRICSDGYYPYCEACAYEPPREAKLTPYCPNCGARMNGDAFKKGN